MLGDDYRMAAENIEHALSDLGDPGTKPYIGRTVIESYWGAAFHWIAYGCDRKHGKQKENHSKLVSFLRDLGEGAISNLWDNLEKRRSGGWYGHQTTLPDVLEAQGNWQDIRTWALS